MQKLKVIAILTVIAAAGLLAYWLIKPRNGAPPRKSDPTILPELPIGIIAMHIRVPLTDIERAIRAEIGNPAVSGITPELDARLLATESISFTDMVKEQIKPYTPGHYVTVMKEEWVAVRESFSCLIKPWKWGNCWRDVMKPILVPVQEWIEPQEAVFQWVSKPATKLLDKVYDVGAWMHYDIFVKDLHLSMAGNQLSVNISTITKLKFDYKQPVVPLGPTVTVKGVFNCEVENSMTLTGAIDVTDSLGLDITLQKDDTKFSFDRVCAPFAIEGLDIMTYLNPAWLGYKEGFALLLRKAINRAINKKLDEEEPGLNFAGRLKAVADKLNDARLLQNNVWLVPNVKECLISNLDSYTEENVPYLRIQVGMVSNPSIVYSIDTPRVKRVLIPVKKASFQPNIRARVEIGLNYASGGNTLTNSLHNFAEKELKKYTLKPEDVTLYPSDSRLVISINFTVLGSNKKSIVCLWGIPKFNKQTNSFWIDSLDYHTKSKNVLIKAADRLFSDKILNYLRAHANWSIDSLMRSLSNRLEKLEIVSEIGTLSGSIVQPNIDALLTRKDQLSLFVDVSGQLSFTVAPQHFVALQTSDLGSLNAIEINTLLKDSTTLPILDVGDSVYRIIQGQAIKEFVTFKFKSLPGDSVFYRDDKGRIQFRILTSADLNKEKLPVFGAR